MIRSGQDGSSLVVTNNTVSGVIIGMVVTWIIAGFVIYSDQLVIGIIIAIASLLGILIIRTQRYVFDREKGTLTISTRSLFRRTETTLSLDDIQRLSVVGRREVVRNSDGKTSSKVTYVYNLVLGNGGNIKLAEMSPGMNIQLVGINENNLPKAVREVVDYLSLPVEIEPEPTLSGAIREVRDSFTRKNDKN